MTARTDNAAYHALMQTFPVPAEPRRDYRWSLYLQMIAPQGRWRIPDAIIGRPHWYGVVEEYPHFDDWEEIASDLIECGHLTPIQTADIEAALSAIGAMRQLRENEYEDV